MGILFVDNGEVRTFDLNGHSSTIGRDGSNDITIKHPTVSRNHARIDEENGQYFLVDFDSRNGTRVNGRAVAENEPLQNGSRLRIGHVRAWFYLKMPAKLPRSLAGKDTGIVFHCACGQRLWSAGDTAGMSVVCNACNQNVEVPPQGDENEEATATVDGAKMAVRTADETSVCGICHWPIDPTEHTHVCPECKTPSHHACWLENLGCSTYGCSQVNALAPKTQRPAEPTIGADAPVIDATAPARPPVAWGLVLLGLSVVTSLLGLLAFGGPAAILGVAALVRLLVTRSNDRPVVAAAAVIAGTGTAAGVLISRLWWFGTPIF